MSLFVVVFVLMRVVIVSGILAAALFFGKLLRDAYRLRLVKKHVEKSKECGAVLLTENLYVVCANDYDKALFPFLKEDIINFSLWDKLISDNAARLNKGYQDSLMKHQRVTIEYSADRAGKERHFKLVFVPAFHSYVVCYACLMPRERTGSNTI